MRQIFFYIPFLHPPRFSFGPIPVYGYGVMLVVGFIAAMYLAQFLARRVKLDPELFANAAILALVSGVLGARLSHVLENLGQYTRADRSAWENFIQAINIREGGLTYYGGFLLAFPSLVLYAKWKKIPLPTGMDIIAPCLMIGLAFGRIGCFMNGCCYGATCDARIGVQFPYGSDAYVTQFNENQLRMAVPRELIRDNSTLGKYMDRNMIKQVQEPFTADELREIELPDSLKSKEQIEKEKSRVVDAQGHTEEWLAAQQRANPVHAAEIYSSVTAFLIAGFLVAFFTLPHVPGRVFAAMMMIEAVFRYVLEMLRVEPAVIGRGTHYLPSLPPQSFSMVVSFVLVIIGALLWYVFGRIAGGGESRSGIRVKPAAA